MIGHQQLRTGIATSHKEGGTQTSIGCAIIPLAQISRSSHLPVFLILPAKINFMCANWSPAAFLTFLLRTKSSFLIQIQEYRAVEVTFHAIKFDHRLSHPLNPFKNYQSSFHGIEYMSPHFCWNIDAGIQVYMAVYFVTSSVSLLMTSSKPFVLLAALSFSLSHSPLLHPFTSSALLPHLGMCVALEEEVR